MRYCLAMVISVFCVFTLSACSGSPAVPPGPLSDSDLDARARAFVASMVEAKYQDAVKMMDDRMASAMPANKVKEVWETLVAQAGPYQSVSGARLTTESGYKCVYVTCRFKDAAVDAKVVLDTAGKVCGVWFGPTPTSTVPYMPPTYVQADAFYEIECTIGEERWKLPATLTMPKGDGAFPAVVLVQGSGPQDRDETIGPNKPFKDLAWGLASKGIAVLRYEKRTKQYAAEIAAMLDSFTVNQETVEDALAAIAFLQQHKSVNPDKVFVLGHSLGASMGPRIAVLAREKGAPKLAGLLLMAPNARSIVDLVVEQTEYIASLDGKVDEKESIDLQKVRSEAARIKGGKLQAGEIVLGGPKVYWEDLLRYDPVAAAKTLGLPVLILQGERDYQVTMKDFAIWKDALQGKTNVTLQSLPGLNHLFMRGEGKSSPQEYDTQANVDPGVIDAIADWLKAR